MATPTRHPLGRPYADGQRTWRRRPSFPQLSLSTILDSDDSDLGDKFFVPTYLGHSVYMQRLRGEYLAKARAKQSKRPTGNSINNTSDTTSVPLPPGSHRGLSHTVIERSPSQDDNDVLTPLPSKWNKDDMWAGVEIDPSNVIRYTAPKNYHERDHEASAVRADNHIPPQCGIYYYEVTILDSRKDECVQSDGEFS